MQPEHRYFLNKQPNYQSIIKPCEILLSESKSQIKLKKTCWYVHRAQKENFYTIFIQPHVSSSKNENQKWWGELLWLIKKRSNETALLRDCAGKSFLLILVSANNIYPNTDTHLILTKAQIKEPFLNQTFLKSGHILQHPPACSETCENGSPFRDALERLQNYLYGHTCSI